MRERRVIGHSVDNDALYAQYDLPTLSLFPLHLLHTHSHFFLILPTLFSLSISTPPEIGENNCVHNSPIIDLPPQELARLATGTAESEARSAVASSYAASLYTLCDVTRSAIAV